MFAKFARFISRHWIAVLGAWIVLAIVFHFVAPRWDDITHDGDFAYLPSRMTSVRGEKLMAKAFPELTAKSNVVLVVERPDGRLTDKDQEIAAQLADLFTPKEGEKSPVLSVLSYKEDDPVGRKLISRYDPKQGQAVLTILQLSTEFMAVDNMHFLNGIYAKVKEFGEQAGFPAGLRLGVTGSAAIGSDALWSMKESVDRTQYTTIALVISILLIVYRRQAWYWCRLCQSACRTSFRWI